MSILKQHVFTANTSGFTGKFYSSTHLFFLLKIILPGWFDFVSFMLIFRLSFSVFMFFNFIFFMEDQESFVVAQSFLFYFLRWRTMFGISVVPSVLLALGMAISPESPRWLFQVFLQLSGIFCCGSIKFTWQLNHWRKKKLYYFSTHHWLL